MYRINDRPAAIERVQNYLRVAGNPEIFVAPTGVYDENTRLSVIDFQEKNGLSTSGIVDRITFEILFSTFVALTERDRIAKAFGSFINFPIIPGSFSDAMIHINRILRSLLNHYGITHDLRESNFYSESTSQAVKEARRIYLLGTADLIDEELYDRMVRDHNSIFKSGNILI